MKKIFLLLSTIFLVTACTDDSDHKLPVNPGAENKELVTPLLAVSLGTNSPSPFTGIIEAYPCNSGTSVYFGNYKDKTLRDMYASYQVKNGEALLGPNPVRLPIGNYNILYWAVPKTSPDSLYTGMAEKDPVIRIGDNLSQQYRRLRKHEGVNDTVYYPSFDLAIASSSVNIGSTELSASLHRAVAAINVTLKNKDGNAFGSEIDTVWVQIGSIAEELNFYTGIPSNMTKTVVFPLVAGKNADEMISKTVTLFPSGNNPLLEIYIVLQNKSIKSFKQNLSGPLTAGNRLRLTLTLDEIFTSETQTGTFQITGWNEKTESIDIPPL